MTTFGTVAPIYLMDRTQMPSCEPEFFDYLGSVDASCLSVYTMKEGCMIFPHEPIIRVEGPIAVCQLLETPLLCMVNYASLVATNAARHRIAVGEQVGLSEFGLRRAQGPDDSLQIHLSGRFQQYK